MQRGKIIQYNPNEGTGIIIADGQQYPFSIALWRVPQAPQVNAVVEFEHADGVLTSVAPVQDSVLIAEKANELKGKLGSLLNSGLEATRTATANLNTESGETTTSSTAIPVSGGIGATNLQGIVGFLGRWFIGGYIVFFLATAFFNYMSFGFMGQSQGRSLLGLAGLIDQAGGSSHKIGLYFAYLSVLVPALWRDRKAWLASLVPILATTYVTMSISRTADQLDGLGGGLLGAFGGGTSTGFGAYLVVPSALLIAFVGVRRFLKRS